MANSDEAIARMKARLVYQVTACDEASVLLNDAAKLLNGVETGDSEVLRHVRTALANIAAIKAISERKLVEGELAVKIFDGVPAMSFSDDDNKIDNE